MKSRKRTISPMDTMPQLASSPSQECTEDAGEHSEDDEFCKFRQFPVSHGCQITPMDSVCHISAALPQNSCQYLPCINQPVEQSQPTSSASIKVTDDQGKTDIMFSEKTSVLKPCFLKNDTDFADFSIFGEQAAQAWCCGLGASEFWDSEAQRGITSGEVAILDSEPKSSAYLSKDDICPKVYHCEIQNKSSQELQIKPHFQSELGHIVDKSVGKSWDSHKERKHSFNLTFLRTSKETEQREEKEKKEKSVSTLSSTAGLYGFQENESFDEGSSQDEPSEDFEPNVSSLASQEDTDTDQDQTDDEEELRNYRLSRSFCNDYIWYNSDVDTSLFYPDPSTAQDSPATFVDSECEKSDQDHEFRGVSLEPRMSRLPLAEEEVQGSLPPSDSFADFCSAPSQEDRHCELFQDHGASGQQDEAASCQIVLHCQIQQLFLDSFPQLVSAEEVEDSVYGLDVLLFIKDQNYHEEEELRHSGLFCVPPGSRRPFLDVLSVAGLQFQWAGSHANRCFQQCLGVDSNNILFIGIKKQPALVSTLTSQQGMLGPRKDSVSAAHFPGQTSVATHAPMRT